MAKGSATGASKRALPSKSADWLTRFRWRIAGWGSLLAIGLAFWGYYSFYAAEESTLPGRLSTALYQTLLTFWFNASGSGIPWQAHLGRMLALVVAGLVGGTVVRDALRQEWHRQRARRLEGHVIVCGVGELGSAAAAALLDDGRAVSIIDTVESGVTAELWRRGAGVVIGDARDPLTLVEAGIGRADEMLVCCGSDDLNSRVAAIASDLDRHSDNPLTVRVHIDDHALLQQLRPFALHLAGGSADVDFFNVAEVASMPLISERIDRPATPSAAILVVGDTSFAESVVKRLAREYEGTPAPRPEVVLACADAGEFHARLTGRYKGIEKRVRLVAHDADYGRLDPAHDARLFAGGRPKFVEAYICTASDVDSMRIALALSAAVRARPEGLRIVACIYGSSGIASLIERSEHSDVEVFDVTRPVRDPRLALSTVEMLAQTVHEDYLRNERAKPSSARTEAFVPWQQLKECYREANRGQVRSFVAHLDAIGMHLTTVTDWDEPPADFTAAEIEGLAENEHERWMEQKLGEGWSYAEPGDREHNKHECLKPWWDLDELQRDKDRATIHNLSRILAKADLEPIRVVEPEASAAESA